MEMLQKIENLEQRLQEMLQEHQKIQKGLNVSRFACVRKQWRKGGHERSPDASRPLRPGIMIITVRPTGYKKKSELAGAGDGDQRVV